MGESGGVVPATGRPVEVKLKCGGVAKVRRIGRSRLTDIMEASRLAMHDLASIARFAELACRYAIVGVQGLKDPDTGDEVPFTTVVLPHAALLGPIASVAVYDALDQDDVLAIADAAKCRVPESAIPN